MRETKSQTSQDEILGKVTKWIGSLAFFESLQRHMTISPTFSIEALSMFERDPILRTLMVARGYAKLGGKLLPLTVTVSTDVTIRIGLIKVVVPMEEVITE